MEIVLRGKSGHGKTSDGDDYRFYVTEIHAVNDPSLMILIDLWLNDEYVFTPNNIEYGQVFEVDHLKWQLLK